MKTVQLRRFFNVKGGTTPSTSESSYWGGSIPWVTPADLSTDGIDYVSDSNSKVTIKGLKENNLLLSEKGWVVFSNRAPIGKVAICGTPLCTNQGCKLIYPNNEKQYNTKYLAYWLISNKAKLNLLGSGTTFNEISTSTLLSFRIPLVDIHQQNKIVDLLDRRVKNIDDVIKEKTIQLEKLSEYRQSLITQAVTKGLDPNVEMKDSGVPWVGMIPYHWKCGKIKYFASISAGGTPDRTVKDYWNNGTIPWIKTGELLNDDIVSVEECITPLALRKSAAKLFPEGTVLVAMYGQGKTRGMAGMLTWPATTNQACACICPKNSLLLGKFLLRLMESSYAFNREKAAGTGQPNLNQDIIANLLIPIPPLDEQMKIINHLDVSLKHIQHMKGTIDGAINKLQEYRSSLITAVVTGKIDINEVNR